MRGYYPVYYPVVVVPIHETLSLFRGVLEKAPNVYFLMMLYLVGIKTGVNA